MRYFYPLMVVVLLASAPVALAANGSGLPVPRFVSLKTNEVNVRTGPGTRYPVQWVYHRAGMPVEVVDEYDLWRKIRDIDGTTGWVHKTMLDGKRSVIIQAKEPRIIRMEPEQKAKPILKAEPGVNARLLECQIEWCRIQLSGRKGWVEKKYLWGIYSQEVFE